jgi:hypothetical protein
MIYGLVYVEDYSKAHCLEFRSFSGLEEVIEVFVEKQGKVSYADFGS